MAELEINNTQELKTKLDEISKDPSINKPTDEEVAKAKEDFDNAKKEFETSIYTIGKLEEAQEFCDYVKHFLVNRFLWQKDAWMGVIKLTEELDTAEILFKGNKEKGFELSYQALEFTYYILTNPGGIGLQAALDFESDQKIYLKTTIAVGQQLEVARKKLKDIEFKRQIWAAMSQGFYLEVDSVLDETLDPSTNESNDEAKEVEEFEDKNE